MDLKELELVKKIRYLLKRTVLPNYQIAKKLNISVSHLYKLKKKYKLSYRSYNTNISKEDLSDFVKRVWKNDPSEQKKLLCKIEKYQERKTK